MARAVHYLLFLLLAMHHSLICSRAADATWGPADHNQRSDAEESRTARRLAVAQSRGEHAPHRRPGSARSAVPSWHPAAARRRRPHGRAAARLPEAARLTESTFDSGSTSNPPDLPLRDTATTASAAVSPPSVPPPRVVSGWRIKAENHAQNLDLPNPSISSESATVLFPDPYQLVTCTSSGLRNGRSSFPRLVCASKHDGGKCRFDNSALQGSKAANLEPLQVIKKLYGSGLGQGQGQRRCRCVPDSGGAQLADAAAWRSELDSGVGRGPTSTPLIEAVRGLPRWSAAAAPGEGPLPLGGALVNGDSMPNRTIDVRAERLLAVGTTALVYHGHVEGARGGRASSGAREWERAGGRTALRMIVPSDAAFAEEEWGQPKAQGGQRESESERDSWDMILRLHALQGTAGIPLLYGAGACSGCQGRRGQAGGGARTPVISLERGLRIYWHQHPHPHLNASAPAPAPASRAHRALTDHSLVRACGRAQHGPAEACALRVVQGAARLLARLSEGAGAVLDDALSDWDRPDWHPGLKSDQFALQNGTLQLLVVDLGLLQGRWAGPWAEAAPHPAVLAHLWPLSMAFARSIVAPLAHCCHPRLHLLWAEIEERYLAHKGRTAASVNAQTRALRRDVQPLTFSCILAWVEELIQTTESLSSPSEEGTESGSQAT